MTLDELSENAEKVLPRTIYDREFDWIRVGSIVRDTYNVKYKAVVKGVNPEPSYRSKIEFSTQETKPSQSEDKCRVYCECPAYFYYFYYWNRQAKADASPGNLQWYRSKGLRPPVNPRHLPGICKHLWKFASELEDLKYII